MEPFTLPAVAFAPPAPTVTACAPLPIELPVAVKKPPAPPPPYCAPPPPPATIRYSTVPAVEVVNVPDDVKV